MEIDANDAIFNEEVLNSQLPVLVDFWATWCGPCRMIAPVIKEIAEEFEGRLKVVKVNVDNCPETSGNYNIMSIPTLKLFKAGVEVETMVGAQPASKIKEMVTRVLSQ